MGKVGGRKQVLISDLIVLCQEGQERGLGRRKEKRNPGITVFRQKGHMSKRDFKSHLPEQCIIVISLSDHLETHTQRTHLITI